MKKSKYEKEMYRLGMAQIKNKYEKENPGVSFPEWLAMKWNSRSRTGIAKAWIVQPNSNLDCYLQTIKP